MRVGHKTRGKQGGRRKANPRKSASLGAHPAFAPLIGLWGALLGGLPVMVLPPAMIAAITRGTAFAGLGTPLQPVLAALAGLVLGSVLFLAASAWTGRLRRRADPQSHGESGARRMQPIDPERDLGTKSLDDPFEVMPFATPVWREADLEDSDAGPEADIALADAFAEAPGPRELDLAEFAALPGPNAVWIDQPDLAPRAAEPAGAPVSELRPGAAMRPPEPGRAALARLRAVPPSELSLLEMVERFAGALHEHRAAPGNRALTAADLAAREAALAEALKALEALSAEGIAKDPGTDREAPLRAALAQLQPRRGTA